MYKIVKREHAKKTQGILRLLMMIPSYYYDSCETKGECMSLLREIYSQAMRTTFLRRNTWEPLYSAYNIGNPDDGQLMIESIGGKPYLEFTIQECKL